MPRGPVALGAAIVVTLGIALVTTGLGGLVLGGPGVEAAAAHTDLLQGSPGPGQRVGGEVDFVDLVFVAPVSQARVEVTGPDGNPIPGEMVVTDGQIIRLRMDALSIEGPHVVSYRMISDDGDDTEAGYSFTYEAGGLQPIRFGPADVPDPGPADALRWALTAVAAMALIALCVVLVVRLRLRRARLAAVLQAGDET